MEDFSFHPILWSDSDLNALGTYSLTYQHVITFRRQIQNEYVAFSAVSPKFASQFSLPDYQVARLLVMTRSFGTGPLPMSEANGLIPLAEELAFYKSMAGVDLAKGSHAMVPVLDLYNHHAKPNVRFAYDASQRAFTVFALGSIPSGREIFDSYGKRTDSDLFAKYGFVNGDGSEYTEASLALWHRISSDDDMTMDKKVLLQQISFYLQYDDGYTECVDRNDASEDEEGSKAWTLKKLKFYYLVSHAHELNRWRVRLPPRNPRSTPALTSNLPITLRPPEFDMQTLQLDGRILISTCRLISLTHWDYNGTATDLLEENRHNATFYPPPTHDALEFRTLMCLARMAQTALTRFGVSVQEQLDIVSLQNNRTFQSRDWTIAHLQLGEMQTLEALKQTAFAGLRTFRDKIDSNPSEPAYAIRNVPCPPRLLQPLLDDFDKNNDG